MRKYTPLFILSILFFLLIGMGFRIAESKATCSKKKPSGNFKYKVKVKEPEMRNLRMIGKVGRFGVEGSTKTERLYGSILRALRFQNITEKLEKKYHLPQNFLLAMVIQETGGADMLLNGLDDGGAGICHMQGSTASEFGLSTYEQCDKLRCKEHGKELRSIISKHKYDRRKLIEYDDRFHPIYNLDAAARMLSCYKYPKVKGFTMEWSSSIYRYAGRKNYRKYWLNVRYFMKKLNDEKVINAVRKEFNSRNPNFTVNGKKSDFDGYIKAHQQQNINYGLNNYK